MAKPLKVKNVHPDDPATETAVKIMRTRLAEFYSHWPEPEQRPTAQQLHDLRIAGKRLRYSAEQLRELYPDRLTLLIELLKRSQDLLGVMQDCVTQRAMIAADLARLRRRRPESDELAALEKLCAEYDRRQHKLSTHFRELWQGMTMDEFREGLNAMVSQPKGLKTEAASSLHLVHPD